MVVTILFVECVNVGLLIIIACILMMVFNL